jgi:MoaA/NifB/PqqE/SkfB family radical SAM enzyme
MDKRGNLALEDFKKIIDDIAFKSFYYPTITLYNRGEPLLNVNLSEMIKYAKNRNLEVTISTNGTLLVDKNIRGKLLRSGVYLIIISIDGINKETYEKNRLGAKFEEVKAGIKSLIEERAKLNLGYARPFIEVQYIVTRQTEKGIPLLDDFKNELGVDNVRLKTFKVQQINRDEDEILRQAMGFIPENKKYSRYLIKNNKLLVKENTKKCEWGYNCVVLYNGDMVTCCEDLTGRYSYGNVIRDGFWGVYSRSELRKRVLNKRLPICRLCS